MTAVVRYLSAYGVKPGHDDEGWFDGGQKRPPYSAAFCVATRKGWAG